MAAGPPLDELLLSASSVADDLGYVALADLARVIGDAAADCRVIGGHMVTVLAARWMLGGDIADIWRCLEIGLAAGVRPQDFSHGDRREAAEIIRRLFARRDAPGMTALAAELGLSGQAADQRATRIRALVTRIIG